MAQRLVLVFVALAVAIGWFVITAPPGTPSSKDCLERWNRPSNQAAWIGASAFSVASVEGWDGEGGAACVVYMFDRPGRPWAMFTLWVANPDGTPAAYSFEIDGTRYGEELGAPEPTAPNAAIRPDGHLGSLEL